MERTPHVQISSPPAADLLRDDGNYSRTAEQPQNSHPLVQLSGTGESASTYLPPVVNQTKMDHPASHPVQSGLHFNSALTTAVSQPTKASQLRTDWDEKSPHQPESVQRAKQHSTTPTFVTLPHDTENIENLKDNHKQQIQSDKASIKPATLTNLEANQIQDGSKDEAEVRGEWVKEHTWEILRHRLSGAERIGGSVLVETELHGSQHVLVIKCYGPAGKRARDIKRLLKDTKIEGFKLDVREESQPGTDFSLLWGPGPWDEVGSSSGMPEDVPVAGVSIAASRPGDTQRTAKDNSAYRFADTPYWNFASTLVDCLLPPRPQLTTDTLCGALVRMVSWEYQEEPQLRTWTCGGLIHVNGKPYALTTAHPLVLNASGKEQHSVGVTRPSVIRGVFPAELDLPSEGQSIGKRWQTLGRVHKHAMSNGFHVPVNYDWLLIDISKDHLLPNFPADHDRDITPVPQSEKPRVISICTWRGSLQAILLPGLSFMILGQSSFKAMKLSVGQPMSALDFLIVPV